MEGKVWSGWRIEKVLSSVNRRRIGNAVREERERESNNEKIDLEGNRKGY